MVLLLLFLQWESPCYGQNFDRTYPFKSRSEIVDAYRLDNGQTIVLGRERVSGSIYVVRNESEAYMALIDTAGEVVKKVNYFSDEGGTVHHLLKTTKGFVFFQKLATGSVGFNCDLVFVDNELNEVNRFLLYTKTLNYGVLTNLRLIEKDSSIYCFATVYEGEEAGGYKFLYRRLDLDGAPIHVRDPEYNKGIMDVRDMGSFFLLLTLENSKPWLEKLLPNDDIEHLRSLSDYNHICEGKLSLLGDELLVNRVVDSVPHPMYLDRLKVDGLVYESSAKIFKESWYSLLNANPREGNLLNWVSFNDGNSLKYRLINTTIVSLQPVVQVFDDLSYAQLDGDTVHLVKVETHSGSYRVLFRREVIGGDQQVMDSIDYSDAVGVSGLQAFEHGYLLYGNRGDSAWLRYVVKELGSDVDAISPVDDRLSLYPNPSQGLSLLNWRGKPFNGIVTVFSLSGEVVCTQYVEMGRLKLQSLPGGYYYLIPNGWQAGIKLVLLPYLKN